MSRRHGRARSFLTILPVLAVFAVCTGPAATQVLAADPVFGTPKIGGTFGQGIQLTQPVTLDEAPARVEALLTFADAPGPLVIEVPPPTTTGSVTLRYESSGAGADHIVPNTPISARWRITPKDGKPVVGPTVDMVYADGRFDWQTMRGDIVRLHWYEGDKAFGERVLKIGDDAINETAKLLGVTEDKPVDFFVYADVNAFYDALGPGTPENVGGQAHADIRTMFALITPAEIDQPWVESVVPHELVHLVFDTAVQNPYHFPPRWLNEGLAVYLSDGYTPSDRSLAEGAARDGTIFPLDGLVGQFPPGADFFLAYAESASAVDFLVRTHDKDALVALIGSYADGRTDDEAFKAAIGMDTAAFNDAWLADLGAQTPVRLGPQPAAPGPRPPAWGAAGGPGASSAPGDPAPIATPTLGTGGQPTSPAGAGSTLVLAVIAVALIAAAGALAWSRSRRDRRPAGP